MYVLASVAAGADDVFLEIAFEIGRKLLEHVGHLLLGALCDPSCNLKERFMRFELGPQGQVLPHDLPLVELADLHRNILENARYSLASVENDRLERVPPLLEISACRVVLQLCFVPQFVYVQILGLVRVSRHQDPVLATKERDVHDDDHWPRLVYFLGNNDRIELFGDGASGDTGIFSQLFLRLLSTYKSFPELCCSLLCSPRTAR